MKYKTAQIALTAMQNAKIGWEIKALSQILLLTLSMTQTPLEVKRRLYV